jgi:sialidase-1
MLNGIVTKNDSVWQGHPDVALFNNEIFVVCRESDHHMARSYTRISLVRKNNHNFSDPITIAESSNRFNCPRLSVIGDTLWLICDEVSMSSKGKFFKLENDENETKTFLWKTTDGINWEGPIETNIKGIVPDRICPTDDGVLVATHTKVYFGPKSRNAKVQNIQRDDYGFLAQNIWHATDIEGKWTKHSLCHKEGYNICEASVCRLHNGNYLSLMRENSGKGLPAFACFSRDGITWSSPIETRMFGCHRPVTGQLKSGNLLTTYREASGSFFPGFWAKNTFACLTSKSSIQEDMVKSIILPLNHDNSARSDSGYTGWVQMPDESIFIVDYTTRDAPRPYIKWNIIHESDF